MYMFNYLRGADNFAAVCEHVVGVESFHDFPSSLLTYGESLKNSTLWSVDDAVFFRKRNKQLTLLAWFCDNEHLNYVLSELVVSGYRMKSFAFTYSDDANLITKGWEWEYYVDDTWNFEWLLSKVSSETRRKLRRAHQEVQDTLVIDWNVDLDSAVYLHDVWLAEAKHRHFMTLRGYSERFIARHYMFGDNTTLFGWRDASGALHGMVGYELYDNQVQMLLTKHMVDRIKFFGPYMWAHALDHIIKIHGVVRVHCGRSADTLKQRLRMQKIRSWKVVV